MILCSCKAITENEMRERIKKSSLPSHETVRRCGVAQDCGSCARQAERICSEFNPTFSKSLLKKSSLDSSK